MAGDDAQQAVQRCLTLARWYLDPTIERRCEFTSTIIFTCDQCRERREQNNRIHTQLFVHRDTSVAQALQGSQTRLTKRRCDTCGHVGAVQDDSPPMFTECGTREGQPPVG